MKETVTQPNTVYAAVYARYSDGSHQTDQSIEGQLAEARRYAQADPPVRFVLSPDATAEDLDEAVRIIASLRDPDK